MSLADDVTIFITEELVSEITADQLDTDYDLLESGLVDSLGLVRLITWVGTKFDIDIDAVDINPDQFRTVDSICSFVERFTPVSPA